jgi:ribosomal protein S18 acetylase RimI-like enzyme
MKNPEKAQFTKIREAKVDDYLVCLPLLTALYHGDIGSDFRRTFEDFVESEHGIVLIAENTKVLGVLVGGYHLDIDWEGKTAKIDAIIVDETSRKRGIGTELVRHFIADAKRKNCEAVKSRVNTENFAAQEFHRTLGFTKARTYEYFLDFMHPPEKLSR